MINIFMLRSQGATKVVLTVVCLSLMLCSSSHRVAEETRSSKHGLGLQQFPLSLRTSAGGIKQTTVSHMITVMLLQKQEGTFPRMAPSLSRLRDYLPSFLISGWKRPTLLACKLYQLLKGFSLPLKLKLPNISSPLCCI